MGMCCEYGWDEEIQDYSCIHCDEVIEKPPKADVNFAQFPFLTRLYIAWAIIVGGEVGFTPGTEAKILRE